MHAFYILTVTLYIYDTFLIGVYGTQTSIMYAYLMMIGIFYPLSYDIIQLKKQGKDYFLDAWNFTDVLFSFSGLLVIFFQFTITH